MPRPVIFVVTVLAPACTVGTGGCGSLSLAAGNLCRAHIGVASENIHYCSRPARRLRKDTR